MKTKLLFEALLSSLKANPYFPIEIHLNEKALEDKELIEFLDAIKGYSNIQSLDLGHNPKLTEQSLMPLINLLPQLKTLTVLKLQGLSLTEASLFALGKALEAHQGIEVLDLSHNALSEAALKYLGAVLKSNPIKVLLLEHCHLNACAKELAPFVSNCSKTLQFLNLSQNRLNSTIAAWLQPILSQCYELQGLDVSHNEELGSHGAEAIAQAIAHLSHVRILNLNQVALSGGLEPFFVALGKHSSLRSLSLAHNELEISDSFILKQYLPHYSQLLSLDLANNSKLIEGDGSLGFGASLSEMTHLQSLNLSDTACTINLHSLMPHLKRLRYLKVLELSHSKLKYKLDLIQLGALLKALPHFPQLRLLDLSFNQLQEEAGILLGQSLSNQAGIESLDLEGNPLGEKGGRELLKGLTKHPTLERLNLAKTKLQVLPTAKCFLTLKSLDLNDNGLTDESILILCELLEKTQCLQELNLSGNSFNQKGLIKFIQQGLSSNITLSSLALTDIKLNEDTGKVLEKLFIQHPTLQKLIVRNNELPAALVESLESLNIQKQSGKMLISNVPLGLTKSVYQAIVLQASESERLLLPQCFLPSIEIPVKPIAPKIESRDTIPYTELVLEKKIAEGSFGKIYKGSWKHQTVAIKALEGLLTEEDKAQFIREVQIMSRARNKYITQFYGASLESRLAYLVMEYMERGSLYQLLEKVSLTPEQQKSIALDIARGLQYLHSQGILHRDLKSANILINEHFQAKLTDFGLSKTKAASVKTIAHRSQAIQWQAPECLQRHGNYTAQSDIYSYGVILWEIVTGKRPYASDNNNAFLNEGEIIKQVLNGKRETIPATVPETYANLIKACWEKELNKRPSLELIIQKLEAYSLRPPSPSSEEYYNKGIEFERLKDFSKALEAYQKASNKGYVKAHTNLGLFFLKGVAGIAQDKSKAYHLFLKAANEGHPRAMFNVAMMLKRGDGVDKDLNQALIWYEKAAAKGVEGAEEEAKKLREILKPTSKYLSFDASVKQKY